MTLNGVMAVILRYFSEFGYLPGVLRKSSRSLSHLLMSSCFAIGKGNKLRISDMNLGPNSREWCDSFKYLGVAFQAGLKLKINIDMI